MEEIEIKRQMAADARLTYAEIADRLLADISDESRDAAIRRIARKRRLAIEFGNKCGWTLARKPFGRIALTRSGMHGFAGRPDDELPHEFFDHPYFYRIERRAVAIAAHLYGFSPERLKAFCRDNGIQSETPDFPSWWYPGHTKLVVFTKASASGVSGGQGTIRDHAAL